RAKYESEIVDKLFSDYDCEIRYHPGKANVVADALSRKEWMERVRAMSMTIHSSIKSRILEEKYETSKDVNTSAEMLRGLYKQFKRKITADCILRIEFGASIWQFESFDHG
nr:putative reverse transcriptase domain-containing protein [Tanacetum cinerariifolium]